MNSLEPKRRLGNLLKWETTQTAFHRKTVVLVDGPIRVDMILGMHMGANAADIVIVVDAVHRGDGGTTANCPSNPAYHRSENGTDRSRRRSCDRSGHCATDTTERRALFGITGRVVINSVLNVIVCHDV